MSDWDEQLQSVWNTQVEAIRERFTNGEKLTDPEIRRLFAEIDGLRVERDLAWKREQHRIDDLAGEHDETETPPPGAAQLDDVVEQRDAARSSQVTSPTPSTATTPAPNAGTASGKADV